MVVAGASVAGPGGRGGGAGPRGWSGGGGGGGGASAVLRWWRSPSRIVLVAVEEEVVVPTGELLLEEPGLGIGGRPFTNNELNHVSVGGNGGDCDGPMVEEVAGGGGSVPRDLVPVVQDLINGMVDNGGEGGISDYRSDIVNLQSTWH